MRGEALPTVTAICRALSEQIGHGLLPTGGKPLAEYELSESFAVTQITLRKVPIQLEPRGLTYHEGRRGWFVSPERLAYNPLVRSHFHAMVNEQDRTPATKALSVRQMPASAAVRELLELPVLSSAYQIRRARRVDGRLVLYVEHYLNAQYFPGILGRDLTCSLAELYVSEYDIHYGRMRLDTVLTALYAEAAVSLRAAAGGPTLRISRINRNQHDRLIDCDLEFWRHDAIHISVEVPQ